MSEKADQNYDTSRFSPLLNELERRFPQGSSSNNTHLNSTEATAVKSTLIVSIEEQKLYCIQNFSLETYYQISTAEAGSGNLSGSFKTPLGIHCIREKIGANAEIGSIFKGRKNTYKKAEIILDPSIRSEEDNITSRILWLKGLENGVNLGVDNNNNQVDSYSRYIYIHGTDEEGLLGKPASHGCVRMANKDIIELYDKVNINDVVIITNN